MNRYEIRCTEAQTKKALELGAPIEFEQIFRYNWKEGKIEACTDIEVDKNGEPILVPVTAEQMLGWLEEQGLLISVLYGYDVSDKWGYDIDSYEYIDYKSGVYNSRKEATLAAIGAALKYLSNKK